MTPSISIIIPALNEENNLKSTVDEVLAALHQNFSEYEILIFDDGSSDKTGIIADGLAAQDNNIKVIHNRNTMGLGYNYKKGVELAEKDYVVMFPGDNSFPRGSIRELFKLVGEADIIVPHTRNFWVRPRSRQIISRSFTDLMNLLFGLDLKYYNGTVIHKRETIKSVPISTNGFAYQAEILTRLIRSGHSFVEVGIDIRERTFGRSKAFAPRNIASVIKTLAKLFWQIYIKERDKFLKPIDRIEPVRLR